MKDSNVVYGAIVAALIVAGCSDSTGPAHLHRSTPMVAFDECDSLCQFRVEDLGTPTGEWSGGSGESFSIAAYENGSVVVTGSESGTTYIDPTNAAAAGLGAVAATMDNIIAAVASPVGATPPSSPDATMSEAITYAYNVAADPAQRTKAQF